jgi:hypothetical protein
MNIDFLRLDGPPYCNRWNRRPQTEVVFPKGRIPSRALNLLLSQRDQAFRDLQSWDIGQWPCREISVTREELKTLLGKGSNKMLIPLVPWLHSIFGWQFWNLGDGAFGARVIEFRVPANFRAPEKPWLPTHARGQLIEFPSGRKRKSA